MPRPLQHWFAALTLCTLASACASEVVVHQLDERSANELLVVLGAQQVAAQKVAGHDGTWDVAVAPSQQARALSVLGSAGLPHRVPAMPALDGGLVPSEESEAAGHARATSAALESTLLAIPGVYDARVHVVLPPRGTPRGPVGEQATARASIVVVHDTHVAPPGDETVRAIVQGAVPGIGPEGIAVVWSPITLPTPPPSAMVTVGPFVVPSESAMLLKAVLAGLAGAVSALTLLSLGLAMRLRRQP